jgi:hypothetical protein
MARLSQTAESHFFLNGIYPESVADLMEGRVESGTATDPWGRPYRVASLGQRLIITGSDAVGEPAPILTLSRSLAWDGDGESMEYRDRPGVRLID